MRVVKCLGLYIIAVVLFPYEWLLEQRSAIRMAWLLSFAEAHAAAREIWRTGQPPAHWRRS